MKTEEFRATITVLFLALCGPGAVRAADLMTVWRQAEASSPTLARAQSLLRAEESGRAEARSALAPQVAAGGSVSRNQIDLTGFGASAINTDYTASSYSVTLTQALFDGRDWAALESASAEVRSAEAAAVSAAQELMLGLAQAYFGVLRAAADERTARSRLDLLDEVLKQSEAARTVGTGDVIAVQNARAERDAADAALLAARNAVRQARCALERLTHEQVGALADLAQVAPEGPRPDRVEEWVRTALERQPLLRQARERLQARLHAAEVAERTRWPTLSLDAGYSYADGAFAPMIERKEALVGVTASWPLFRGGGLTAARRQAEALAEATRFEVANMRDTIRLHTEQAFFDLQDSVAQWQATQQARDSAALSLQATRKGYTIGSRSVLDVLEALRRQTDAETAWNRARYRHVLSRLQLKAAAGLLSKEDLASVNALLQTRPAEAKGAD